MHDPFEICPQVFNDSEIEFIKECGHSSNSTEQTGVLVRTKISVGLPPMLENKLRKVVENSSYSKWFNLLSPTRFEKYVLSQYNVGQSFKVHHDVSQNELLSDSSNDRKISIITLLDDHYEGGEFFMNDVGLDDPCLITLKPGDVLLFPSFVEHSMNAITSGQRVSLTTWVLGPRWC
ncbi:MAG: 2OG-Fe(II) oxygenase [Methylophagaceae bacterium]